MAIFAKALASGYPISAITGKREWMQLIEDGKVIHAGTMNSGNPSVAAALATIEVLEQEQPHERMFYLGQKLMNGLQKSAQKNGLPLMVQGPGPMFHTGFTSLTGVKDFRDTLSYDKAKLSGFIAAMHNHNIRIIGRGLWYISAAHTEEDIDQAIHIAGKVLSAL
jgi:glutamate-1-semialdehyde 2,1-aminomutase